MDNADVLELDTVTEVEVVGVVDNEVVVGESARLVLELDEMLRTLDEALAPGLDMLDGLETVAPDEVDMLEDTPVVVLDVGLVIVLVLLVEVAVEVKMLVLDVVEVLALAEVLELLLELLAVPDEVIVFDVEV
ncbi:hypothetical protein CPLU01_08698 [Colletotrichum plurivorum]|uniref:Uncharacterized protein n=1 Tax=Colletotrichum plurivorum TaxID=2175906 RepID=A0A8H6KCA3_9PEZI|nr:hypothetical protein CPLU01_08698 [Colletotrichum plurivorum]